MGSEDRTEQSRALLMTCFLRDVSQSTCVVFACMCAGRLYRRFNIYILTEHLTDIQSQLSHITHQIHMLTVYSIKVLFVNCMANYFFSQGKNIFPSNYQINDFIVAAVLPAWLGNGAGIHHLQVELFTLFKFVYKYKSHTNFHSNFYRTYTSRSCVFLESSLQTMQ